MGRHINENGEFASTKYTWCPPGFFPLKLTDPIAQLCVLTYAELTDQVELADDLQEAIAIIKEGTEWIDKQ